MQIMGGFKFSTVSTCDIRTKSRRVTWSSTGSERWMVSKTPASELHNLGSDCTGQARCPCGPSALVVLKSNKVIFSVDYAIT